jgi:hypothetical protein
VGSLRILCVVSFYGFEVEALGMRKVGDVPSASRRDRVAGRSQGLPQYLRSERPEFSARRRLSTSDRTKRLVLEFQFLPKEDSVLWSSARSSCNLVMAAAGEIEKKGPEREVCPPHRVQTRRFGKDKDRLFRVANKSFDRARLAPATAPVLKNWRR